MKNRSPIAEDKIFAWVSAMLTTIGLEDVSLSSFIKDDGNIIYELSDSVNYNGTITKRLTYLTKKSFINFVLSAIGEDVSLSINNNNGAATYYISFARSKPYERKRNRK